MKTFAIEPEELKRLVKGCVKGEPKARKQLYDMHAAQMLSVCYRYTKNKNDAEEVFQQGFYLVFKNIDNLKDPAALSGWVKRIFVNAALHHNEQEQRMYAVGDATAESFVAVEVNTALSNIESRELTQLIQQLPHGCREVFNLYVVEGYSHKEIAEQLNISVGTSKSQLFEARRVLKRAIVLSNQTAKKKIS